jgi:Dynein attachment factor N-terminus
MCISRLKGLPVMDPESLPLCFVQMEKDLYVALETDTQRELENEAKFRAIAQKVSTYDEFRLLQKEK